MSDKKKKKKDDRFQDLERPAELKGRCPVCSAEMVNAENAGTRFLSCRDHYKIEAVEFEKAWQDFLTNQGSADDLIKKLLDGNQAENITPMKILKANLYGPK